MSYPVKPFEIFASSGASPVWVCHPNVLRVGSEYSVVVTCPDLFRLFRTKMTLSVTMTLDKIDTVVASCSLFEHYLHEDQRVGNLVFPRQEAIAGLQKLFLAASAASGTTKVPVGMNESGCSARVTVNTVSGVTLSMNVGVVLANLG